MGYSVVWFKRDLRLHDHAPLWQAAREGPLLRLYVLEPSLWSRPEGARQYDGFLRERLRDLARQFPDYEPCIQQSRMQAALQQRCGLRLGPQIAPPLVGLESATRAAKARLHARCAQPELHAACHRPMVWRKRWERVWEEVRYCSERCRRQRGDAGPGSLA